MGMLRQQPHSFRFVDDTSIVWPRTVQVVSGCQFVHLRLREHLLISGPRGSVRLEVRAGLRPHARRWTGAGHSMFSLFPYRPKAWPRARRRIARCNDLAPCAAWLRTRPSLARAASV